MTSRRGRLIEDGARELLQFHGYKVRVLPVGFNKRLPPAHLVATRPSGETRFIRITKLFHQSSSVQTVEQRCYVGLAQLRKHQALHSGETGLHYEIWCYSLSYGFRRFEVQKDCVREIPKLTLYSQSAPPAGGIA
jgi:hypothetical protein